LPIVCAGGLACAKSGPQSQPDRSPTDGQDNNAVVAASVNMAACEGLPSFTPVTSFAGPVVPGQVIPVGLAVDPIAGNTYEGVMCVDVDHTVPVTE
ncbi:MAG: hypothetical protein ACPG4T_17250, partial [Nannocystaceae bacterium]